ncbi:uncharacterized protein LOC135709556 [Ochlerotatus camptorhynchus]|uniref:uncharacterized protein LOC135709556 n=1 Tax=Ochlerotatus camptorhynchus TaxID=644619 RepID=UPI0031D8407C
MPTREEKNLGDRLAQRKGLLAIRNALEKFVHEYDHDRDASQLCVGLNSLDQLDANFLDCQDAIEQLDKPESLDEHIVERVEFEQWYCKAKGFLLTKHTGDQNQSMNNSMLAPQHFTPNFHLRLPKIDLPKFNGDFSRDALIKRYDNRRYLKKQLFRALYDLPAVKQECAKCIHGLVDDYQRHVCALAKLGEPNWDTPLISLLSYKLDQATLRAWEEKASQRGDVTYEELVDFLYQRVRILNSVGPDSQQFAGIHNKGFKSKVSANAATVSSPQYSCPLSCSDSHSIRSCPVFLGKDFSQRRELISQKRLCWNCLSFGHQSKKCGSKFTCRTCHDKHHSLLHDRAAMKVSATPAILSSSAESQSSTVSPNLAVPSASSVQQSLPSTSPIVEPSGSRQVSMAVQTLNISLSSVFPEVST